MQNASNALIMAGSVLIFIIALTVCISSFTTLRTEVDRIVGQSETIQLAKDSDMYINYIESKKSKSVRIVGAGTVISSMYRSVKENYVIYIKLNNYNSIGSTVVTSTATKDVTIDGNTIIAVGDKIIKVAIGTNTNQSVNAVLANQFYDKIKDSYFNEYLGEYQNASDVTSENKQTYRVITYVEVTP